jgi:co-chaperonin GroES (HSP10)
MDFKPGINKILVKRRPPEDTYGSIFVSESSKVPMSEGKVVALGPKRIVRTSHGEVEREFFVKVGDEVVFHPQHVFPIKVNDSEPNEEYVVIEEDSILGFRQ